MDTILIERTARQFRDAILASRHKLTLPTLKDFPFGSCGDSHLLLARHFIQLGLPEFQRVSAWRLEWSHGWLEYGDLIVDICADQFGQDAVIVSDASEWHGRWANDDNQRQPADIGYDGPTELALQEDFSLIVDEISDCLRRQKEVLDSQLGPIRDGRVTRESPPDVETELLELIKGIDFTLDRIKST